MTQEGPLFFSIGLRLVLYAQGLDTFLEMLLALGPVLRAQNNTQQHSITTMNKHS